MLECSRCEQRTGYVHPCESHKDHINSCEKSYQNGHKKGVEDGKVQSREQIRQAEQQRDHLQLLLENQRHQATTYVQLLQSEMQMMRQQLQELKSQNQVLQQQSRYPICPEFQAIANEMQAIPLIGDENMAVQCYQHIVERLGVPLKQYPTGTPESQYIYNFMQDAILEMKRRSPPTLTDFYGQRYGNIELEKRGLRSPLSPCGI